MKTEYRIIGGAVAGAVFGGVVGWLIGALIGYADIGMGFGALLGASFVVIRLLLRQN